jgi:uncharacterized protein (TIGR02646 family)
MIELTKSEKPESLIKHGTNWTQDLMSDYYLNGRLDPKKQKRYRAPDIKKAVKKDTNDRCAYCESHVDHVYAGDVEHIIPKSIYPRLTFIWSNLTYVCSTCNNTKRDYLAKDCMLLNPYKDTIRLHLRAFGPLIMHVNSSKRGEITHKKLGLNRAKLRDRRLEKIEELQLMIDKYNNESTQSLKDLIKNEIINFIETSEFTFTLKQYFKDVNNL